MPQCVTQCGGRARFFGDLMQGIENFEGPGDYSALDGGKGYEDVYGARVKLGDYVETFEQSDVHRLLNVGNNPSFVYILRNRTWQGGE